MNRDTRLPMMMSGLADVPPDIAARLVVQAAKGNVELQRDVRGKIIAFRVTAKGLGELLDAIGGRMGDRPQSREPEGYI